MTSHVLFAGRARTFEETVECYTLKEESFASSGRTPAATPTSYEDKIVFLAIQHAILSSLRQVVAAVAAAIDSTALGTRPGQGKQRVGNIRFS